MHLTVTNFQSIIKADLELTGLSVLTGRSNLGKSALLRAASAAVFGLAGEYYIREGQDFCGVVLKIDQDEIVWRKTAKPTPTKPTALRVNGVVHTKLGKDHAALTQDLKIMQLDTDRQSSRPQFASQHDLPFLLGENETVAAEVLKMLGRADTVASALNYASADKRKDEGTLKVRTADLGTAQEEVNQLPDIVKLEADLLATKKLVDEHAAASEKKSTIEALIKQRRNSIERLLPAPVPILTNENQIALGLVRRRISIKSVSVPQAPAQVSPPAIAIPLLADFILLQKQLQTIRDDLADVDGDLIILKEVRSDLEAELKVCPTCDRPFDAHA